MSDSSFNVAELFRGVIKFSMYICPRFDAVEHLGKMLTPFDVVIIESFVNISSGFILKAFRIILIPKSLGYQLDLETNK